MRGSYACIPPSLRDEALFHTILVTLYEYNTFLLDVKCSYRSESRPSWTCWEYAVSQTRRQT